MTPPAVHFREVAVFSNTIAIPESKKSVQRAVVEGIGKRPKNERWTASIFERAEDWVVVIEGPNQFKWEQEFFGPSEQNHYFIREAVSKAICSR
jgi:hypothetical protein